MLLFKTFGSTSLKETCRVRASVYPTPHNKIWLSSGRIPLHISYNNEGYLNLSIWKDLKMKLERVNGIKPQSKLWTQNTDSSLQQAVGYYDKIKWNYPDYYKKLMNSLKMGRQEKMLGGKNEL